MTTPSNLSFIEKSKTETAAPASPDTLALIEQARADEAALTLEGFTSMSLNISPLRRTIMSFGGITAKSRFQPAPAGTYAGWLYQVIDLGTQDGGKYPPARKVMLGFELSETMVDGKPFVIARWFTSSTSKKSALRGFLEGMLGRNLTPDEIMDVSFEPYLEKPTLLTVTNESHQDGETKARIKTVSPVPAAMAVPPRVNEPVLFDLSAPCQVTFDKLSDGLRDRIRQSPEFAASGLDGGSADDTPIDDPPPDRNPPRQQGSDIDDNDKLNAIA